MVAWPLPRNLVSKVESSLISDRDVNIGKCLENITLLQPSHVHPNAYVPFYPRQTCSNMCGIIVVCMSAILCECWSSWLKWNTTTSVPLISKPSNYSKELRLIVMSWIMKNSLDVSMFSPLNAQPKTAIIINDKENSTDLTLRNTKPKSVIAVVQKMTFLR